LILLSARMMSWSPSPPQPPTDDDRDKKDDSQTAMIVDKHLLPGLKVTRSNLHTETSVCLDLKSIISTRGICSQRWSDIKIKRKQTQPRVLVQLFCFQRSLGSKVCLWCNCTLKSVLVLLFCCYVVRQTDNILK
jgi:hypothetical protein